MGFSASAQSGPPAFSVHSWGGENGLMAGDIYALARTPDGFLWLGTDVGLIRFDGTRFEMPNATEFPVPAGENVPCLLVDRQGALWAGTGRGHLLRRNAAGQFQEAGPGSLTAGDKFSSLAEDGEGVIWAVTEQHGVFGRLQNQWQVFGFTNHLANPGPDQVLADAQGRLWLLADGALETWDRERGQFSPVAVSPGDPVARIAAGGDGSLWAGMAVKSSAGGARVLRFRAGQWSEPLEMYSWLRNMELSQAEGMLEDSAGGLWVGTAGIGVSYRPAGQPWQHVWREGALAEGKVNALLQDQEGTLWFGVQGGQLFQVRPRVVTPLRPATITGQSVFQTTCARRDGSVWVGTFAAGLYRYGEGEWKHYQADDGLTEPGQLALLEDRQTNLWVGTPGGLFQFDGQQFARASFLPATNGLVRALLEDRRGALWVATAQGLVRRQAGTVTVFGEREGLKTGSEAPLLAEDPGGRVWAVATAGLFRQTGGRFEAYLPQQMPPGLEIRDVLFDAGGALWMATYGSGLLRVKDGQIRAWTVRDGLPSNYLVALVQDATGDLWLGAANGIFGLSRETLDAYVPGQSPPLLSRQVSLVEGDQSQSCSGGGCHVATRTADGRLWFPNQRVLAVFDPAATRRTRPAWTVAVEKVEVDGVAMPPAGTAAIRVPSGTRRIGFHYTLPELLAPAQLRFRTRLAGLENDWVDADWVDAPNDRVADYNRLPPGHYEFQVMASSPEGTWRAGEFPVKLEVVPRLWERTSVRVAGAAGVFGGLSAVVWALSRARLRRRLLLLEAEQAVERARAGHERNLHEERARIARDLHDDLGASLTEITVLAQAGIRAAAGSANSGLFGSIGRKSRQMVSAIDAIVWAVDPEENSLQSLADYLAGFAADYLAASGIACRFKIPVSFPAVTLDGQVRHELFLVVKETLHNVVRHAGATEVELRLALAGRQLEIALADNGTGFDPAAVRDGHGLRNFSERLGKLGGQCTVESRPGQGAMVVIRLPLAGGFGEGGPAA